MSHLYVLDTSGLSNPLVNMPPDIYESLWNTICAFIDSGSFCWNFEIGEELSQIPDPVGSRLSACSSDCCYEVGDDDWDWQTYLGNFQALKVTYQSYISEYNGNRRNTVGLNDVSIVALAQTLGLPIISMEGRTTGQRSEKRIRIPSLCDEIGVPHLDFNQFLRAHGVKI